MAQHKKTPWCVRYMINDSGAHIFRDIKGKVGVSQIAYCATHPCGDSQANAEFIVKCVNSHDSLVEALINLLYSVTSVPQLLLDGVVKDAERALKQAKEA